MCVKLPFRKINRVTVAQKELEKKEKEFALKNKVNSLKRLHRPIKRIIAKRTPGVPLSKSQTIKAAIKAGFSATLFEYLSEGYDSAWFRKYAGNHLEQLRKAGFNLAF